eukprot:gene18985-23263_t
MPVDLAMRISCSPRRSLYLAERAFPDHIGDITSARQGMAQSVRHRLARASRRYRYGPAEKSLGGLGEKTMRVIVMVKATEDSEAGKMPSTELLEAMGKFNEELVNAGIMQAGEGLHPSSRGKRVAFDGASRTPIDGPFTAPNAPAAGSPNRQAHGRDQALAR